MLAFILVFIGVASRLIVHAPNFTPVLAIALFGGVYLSYRRAIVMPLMLMIVSDLFIGLHDTILFTWGSIFLVSLMGVFLRSRKSLKNIALAATVSALVFFVVTNLGAWFAMYPKTFLGLEQCFVAALPFFRDTLVSTLVYSALFFCGYELLARFFVKTPWAGILRPI